MTQGSELIFRTLEDANGAFSWPAFAAWAAAVAVLAGVAVWSYRRGAALLTTARRRLLVTLRMGGIAVAAAAALQSSWRSVETVNRRGTIIVAIDTSRSMSLPDGASGGPSRIDRAADALDRGALARLGRDYDLLAFTFDSGANAVTLAPDGARLPKLAALGAATRLGQATERIRQAAANRPLAGIILATDGGWEAGDPAVEAARRLGARQYILAAGAEDVRDMALALRTAPPRVRTGERFTVEVRVNQSGFAGSRAILSLELFDPSAPGAAAALRAEKDITLTNRAAEEETISVDIDAKKIRPGSYVWRATLASLPGEITDRNNAVEGMVDIDRDKVRVLVIENAPRWEFRYLKNALARDKNASVSFYLMAAAAQRRTAAPGDASAAGESGGAWLDRPPRAEELESYDVIVLGDVEMNRLREDSGWDAAPGLAAWVREHGGGLIVVAGRTFMPAAWTDRAFLDLLPVEVSAGGAGTAGNDIDGAATKGWVPLLAPGAASFPFMKWGANGAAAMPAIYWCHAAGPLRPGAAALLVRPDGAPLPGAAVAALRSAGLGRVMFLGTDELWRMRHKPGAEAHEKLWTGMVQHAGRPHANGDTQRVRIAADKYLYAPGETARVTARVLRPDLEPSGEARIKATAKPADGGAGEEVILAARGGGEYEGAWRPLRSGEFVLDLAAPEGGTARTTVRAADAPAEFEDPRRRGDRLRQLAAATDGACFEMDGIDALISRLDTDWRAKGGARAAGGRAGRRVREADLFGGGYALAIAGTFALFFGAEWWLRKKWDLI
jgi:hypothetical protein